MLQDFGKKLQVELAGIKMVQVENGIWYWVQCTVKCQNGLAWFPGHYKPLHCGIKYGSQGFIQDFWLGGGGGRNM